MPSIRTGGEWHHILSLKVMPQHDNVKCMLAMVVLYDAANCRCGHHDAVNRAWIHLKIQCHATAASRFVVITPMKVYL
ncbi:hypothetical protein TNCV_4652751 [Trichonephila clavipes]|nr:hypothetical protein TNCV_4652751 [Trichonephila clavipes]